MGSLCRRQKSLFTHCSRVPQHYSHIKKLFYYSIFSFSKNKLYPNEPITLVSLCFCTSYKLFNVDLFYYMQKLLLPLPHFHGLVSFSFSSQNMPFSISTSNSSHPIPIAPPTPSTQFMPSNDHSPQEITIFIIWVAFLFIALMCFLCHWVTHKMKSN